MTASSHPGPDDHDALSSWERKLLADIEDDLEATDPRLAEALRRRGHARLPRWWPLSARSTGLLLVALTVLVVAGALLPVSWWPVLGLVTVLVVVPWLLLAAREKGRSG